MKKIIQKTSLTILTIILFTTSCVVQKPIPQEKVFYLPPKIDKKEVINFFADLPFDSDKEIKVALMVPLSGKHEKLGKDLYRAAQLALFDHGDPRIVIYPYDTEASEFKSIELINKIIEEEIKIVIGPVFAKNVKSIKPLAQQYDLKIFTFSNDTSVAGGGVYTLGIDVKQQIARIVAYAIKNDYEYFSALAPANHFGADAVKQLRLSAHAKAMILKSEFYSDNSSLKRNITKVLKSMQYSPVNERGQQIFKDLTIAEMMQETVSKNNNLPDIAENNLTTDTESENITTGVEEEVFYRDINEYKRALLLADSANNLQIIAELADFSKFSGEFKILGTSLMSTEDILTLDIFANAWFTDLPKANIFSFEKHFFDVFGYMPQNMSIFAYDMVSVISALAAYDEVYNISYLENYVGFSGISGVFRFNQNGIVERLFEIYEIRAGVRNTIDPAPFQFEEVTNN